MIKAYKEVTEWTDCEFTVPNHTYLVDDAKKDKMIGYIKEGTVKADMFKKPLPFYRGKRKFKISNYKEA